MSADTVQTTPLHAAHIALGARMMPFGGFDMPVQYTGILDEHKAVREAAGLFDVSHMGEFRIRGPQALDLAQYLVTNDVSKLTDGRALYAVLCHPSGGAVDDLLVYRLAEDDVMLVVNASNIDKDWAHVTAIQNELGLDCTLTNESDDMSLLALQGPKAFDIFQAASGMDASEIPYYHFQQPEPGAVFGADDLILSHTGYTGERGLEIYCRNADVVRIWDALLAAGAEHGIRPAGLGARDTLRLEAGYCLYGHELSDTLTPLDAGLGWVVKLDAGDFVGRDALASLKSSGPTRRLVGFMLDERGIPRQGCPITDAEGNSIGEVTSGSQSPTLGRGIGLGYVPNDPAFTAPGTHIGIDIRGRVLPATIAKPPFHTAG